MAELIIPNSVTSIGDQAFDRCKSLKSVHLPETIKLLESSLFRDCTSLSTITIPSGVKEIGSAFSGCRNLENVYSESETPPSVSEYAFADCYIEDCTLHVPSSSIDAYAATSVWSQFGNIIAIDGTNTKQKCSTPTISYSNGCVSFYCGTEGAEIISEIIVPDSKKYYTNIINLSVTYNLSAYATKSGYEDSETAKATLCWLESDPKTEGINDITRLNSTPVLISSSGSTLNITGADNVNHIEFYNLSGSYLGAEQVINGEASFETDENLVIVKIGDKSIKVKK